MLEAEDRGSKIDTWPTRDEPNRESVDGSTSSLRSVISSSLSCLTDLTYQYERRRLAPSRCWRGWTHSREICPTPRVRSAADNNSMWCWTCICGRPTDWRMDRSRRWSRLAVPSSPWLGTETPKATSCRRRCCCWISHTTVHTGTTLSLPRDYFVSRSWSLCRGTRARVLSKFPARSDPRPLLSRMHSRVVCMHVLGAHVCVCIIQSRTRETRHKRPDSPRGRGSLTVSRLEKERERERQDAAHERLVSWEKITTLCYRRYSRVLVNIAGSNIFYMLYSDYFHPGRE